MTDKPEHSSAPPRTSESVLDYHIPPAPPLGKYYPWVMAILFAVMLLIFAAMVALW